MNTAHSKYSMGILPVFEDAAMAQTVDRAKNQE